MQEFISKTDKPLKFANLNFNLYSANNRFDLQSFLNRNLGFKSINLKCLLQEKVNVKIKIDELLIRNVSKTEINIINKQIFFNYKFFKYGYFKIGQNKFFHNSINILIKYHYSANLKKPIRLVRHNSLYPYILLYHYLLYLKIHFKIRRYFRKNSLEYRYSF